MAENRLERNQINYAGLGLYFLVHVAFCSLYMALLVVAALNSILWLVIGLGGVVVISSLWARRETSRRRNERDEDFPFHPTLVIVTCLLLWLIAFPFFLTSRKYYDMRLGKNPLRAHHFPRKNR